MDLNSINTKYRNLSDPVKASLWYTVCNVLNKGLALLSTPIFTRLMTETQYGTFAVFQSWYSIIFIFTSLNIFLGGYTKGMLLYKDDLDGFTSTQLSLTTVITIIFGCVYLLSVDFWTQVFELSPMLMGIMFLELLTMPALEFWAARERFDYRYKKYVVISLCMSVLSLGGGVLAVMNTDAKVEARVCADVFAKAMFAGTLFVLLLARGKKFFDAVYWKYALKFNIPLIPHYLSNYVLTQSDRLMISKMIGNDKAAYYSVAYTISTVINLVMTAVNNSLTPYIYKSISSGKTGGIKKVTAPLFVLMAGLSILTMAFAPEVIVIFAGRNYMEAIYVIPPIAASVYFIFLYAMCSTIEYYYQKTGLIAVATCISATANLLLNYIFINFYGYYAAGYTTLICYVCLATMHYIFYKKVLKEYMPDVDNLYNTKLIIGVSVFVLAIMLLMIMTYHIFMVRYLIIAVMLATAIIKRNVIARAIKDIGTK